MKAMICGALIALTVTTANAAEDEQSADFMLAYCRLTAKDMTADIKKASSPEKATTARKSSAVACGTWPGSHARPPSAVRRKVPCDPLAQAIWDETALTP